jgi:rhodanese-related sulfurtransferase
MFSRVTADEAEEMIKAGKVRVIDVREPGEYSVDHIANSELIPLNRVLNNPSSLGEPGILLVCEMGVRSAVAAEMATAVGLTDIYNLEGGMNAWRGKGKPVEK